MDGVPALIDSAFKRCFFLSINSIIFDERLKTLAGVPSSSLGFEPNRRAFGFETFQFFSWMI